MNFVEPIRDRRKISQIKNNLRFDNRARDLLLFTTGVNSALRVSDLLQLRAGQFFTPDGSITNKFSIREAKRNKRYELIVNDSITEALALYRQTFPDALNEPTNFLFFNPREGYQTAIQRGQCWKLIGKLCEDVGLAGNYGTHTLRKTWAYQAWKAGVDLYLIMVILNHSSLEVTKRYLGITDDERAEVLLRLNL